MTLRSFLLPIIVLQAVICQANIIQRNSIKAVLDEIQDEHTLVVFDIDETLIRNTYLGYRKGYASDLTEKEVISVVAEAQKRTNKKYGGCIALTARPWFPKNVEFTAKQLGDFGISFSHSTPWWKDNPSFSFEMHCPHYIDLQNSSFGAGYKDGILYVGCNSKGTFLVLFLMLSGCKPSKVVFIDDHLPFIKVVDEQLTKYQVPHVCIHYVPSNLT
jgi:hypothetical protein